MILILQYHFLNATMEKISFPSLSLYIVSGIIMSFLGSQFYDGRSLATLINEALSGKPNYAAEKLAQLESNPDVSGAIFNYYHEISSFPTEFSGSQVAQEGYISIVIRGGSITSIPEEIGLFKKLSVLDLADNRIDSFPSDIGNVASLQKLDLSGNRLTSLPDLGNLQNLEELVLADNDLSVLPSGISNLDRIRVIDLRGNNLPPSEVENLRVDLPGTKIYF